MASIRSGQNDAMTLSTRGRVSGHELLLGFRACPSKATRIFFGSDLPHPDERGWASAPDLASNRV